jgi:hypothetical protein
MPLIFLSEERRIKLITALAEMGMHVDAARQQASYPDDLRTLDLLLADLVLRLVERYQRLRLAAEHGNEELRDRMEKYMTADMLTFESYCREIRQRKLPSFVLPKASLAVQVVRIKLNETGDLLREALNRHNGRKLP